MKNVNIHTNKEIVAWAYNSNQRRPEFYNE